MSNGVATNGTESQDQTHTPCQRYLSTRGEDGGVCFFLCIASRVVASC